METIIILLILFNLSVFGQDWNQTIGGEKDSICAKLLSEGIITEDSTTMCEERGHIFEIVSVTLMGYIPQYVDLGDRTLKITHDPNIQSGYCERCKLYVTEPVQGKPDTLIIWKREKQTDDTHKN